MTRRYAITGAANGIGAAVVHQLKARGDEVITIDIKQADIIADLSTVEGRQQAVAGLQGRAQSGLDGLVPCAGLGPSVKPFDLITRVNFFGTTALVEGARPLLERRRGRVVLVSSNSAPMGHHKEYVKALLTGNEAEACQLIAGLDGQTAYGGAKYALAVWMRRQAPGYMKESGVALNAVAPGITRTAMTDGVFADATWGDAIRQFSDLTPCGTMATPEMIANAIVFLLDPAAAFVCGSVLFVDGGTDALLRPEQF